MLKMQSSKCHDNDRNPNFHMERLFDANGHLHGQLDAKKET